MQCMTCALRIVLSRSQDMIDQENVDDYTLQMVSQPSPDARLLKMFSRSRRDQWLLAFVHGPDPAGISRVCAKLGDSIELSMTDCTSGSNGQRAQELHNLWW